MSLSPAGRPVAASAIEEHVYKVFPNDLNAQATVFGGMIMAQSDRLALVVAERHSGRVCVTASVDSLHFTAPAKANDTLLFRVSLNRSWHSSMEIGVKVVAEDSYAQVDRHVVSAYFTFVALNDDGKPVTVGEVLPQTSEQKRRYEQAGMRRDSRLAIRQVLKDYRKT